MQIWQSWQFVLLVCCWSLVRTLRNALKKKLEIPFAVIANRCEIARIAKIAFDWFNTFFLLSCYLRTIMNA